MISFKKSISNTLGDDVDLSDGIKKSLLNDFYKKKPDTFPYQLSVRSIIKALEWPKNFHSLPIYPYDTEPEWVDNVQGLDNDGINWYITQETSLWKIPASFDLASEIDNDDLPQGILTTGIPHSLLPEYDELGNIIKPGVNHLGDLDYYDGHLYVPCEGTSPGKIALFNAVNLAFISTADLDIKQGGSAPWCAINPVNGLLYSLHFDPNYLHVYKPNISNNQLKLDYMGEFHLFDRNGGNMKLSRIQGGKFSNKGHLYLVSDTPPSGHILGFDMITGRNVFRSQDIYLEISSLDSRLNDELEGMTIWDLDSIQAPNIGGQIHVLRLVNQIDSDNIKFLHFGVSGEDKDKI